MNETRKYPGWPPPAPNGPDPYHCESGHQNAADDPGFRCGSATDFTGLIPSLPESEFALEAYADLYHYPGDILRK
ncbi:MAG: hypothetical protein LUE65_03605 [Clostridiales bacterium]|nr:hypothetical protein [Clostridiales bacterium]MCD8369416.1 hypothetical protein [Clostridiales bacterium]